MPAPHHSVLYRPDALPAAQPTASKALKALLRSDHRCYNPATLLGFETCISVWSRGSVLGLELNQTFASQIFFGLQFDLQAYIAVSA